jgi:nucleotide-binding universal stress UspA family protein
LDRFVAPLRAQSRINALQQLKDLIAERATGGRVETVVREGAVADQTLRLAQQQHADLIVTGVHGRSALDLTVFGSNTKTMIAHAHCPVLVIPASRRGNQMKRQGA